MGTLSNPERTHGAPTFPSVAELFQQRLTSSLTAWRGGVYDPTNRHQRQAATDAIDTLDEMLRWLHELRSELITQTRRYDDESLRRTDALLARIHTERDGGGQHVR